MRILSFILVFLISVTANAQRDYLLTNGPLQAAYRPSFAPLANAGPTQSIQLPYNQVTLSGSGTDYDGTIVAYHWELIEGSGGIIFNPNAQITLVNSLTEGVRKFQLTVTDNKGLKGYDTVIIITSAALNVLPVANAGADSTIIAPVNTCTLIGAASDADGTVSSVTWTKVTGSPLLGDIVSPTSLTTALSNLVNGVYTFQLTVVDNSGGTTIDFVTITVIANPVVTPGDGKFSFTLDTSSVTSAGVYTKKGVLVRTLWTTERKAAGTHTAFWDGTDDQLNPIVNPDTGYDVQVLSHNVQYEWKGTIGNNSDSSSGDTKHRIYYRCMSTLAFGAQYGYYAGGYAEGSPSLAKFNINSPGIKISLPYGSQVNTGDINYVATDNNYVYWALFDANSTNNSGVFATKVSDDTEVPFTAGAPFPCTHCRKFPYTISVANQAASKPTGLAVGNYLFVARAGIDQLKVHDKTSGELLHTITLDSVRGLAADPSGGLWAITGAGTVAKYTVNGNGSIGAAILTLAGLNQPLSVSVNPGGSVVSVSDGGTSQQVKHFNNINGALTFTLGTLSGYANVNGATVNNNKFYFTDIDGAGRGENEKYHFVAYQADGSYWVNDPGNYRVQKYSAAHSYVRRLQWLGSSLSTAIDPGNIHRIFYKFLEFEMNYLTGEWALVKNWGNRISTSVYNAKYDTKFKTLYNGQRFGLITKGFTAEILELTAADTVRPTGKFYSPGYSMEPDGSLLRYLRGNYGGRSSMLRYALTGFSGGNPTYATTPTVLFTSPILTKYDANGFPRTGSSVITSSGKVITYDAGAGIINNRNIIIEAKPGFHLQAIQLYDSIWNWKTQLSTYLNYRGDYPDISRFEVGNNVSDFAGGGMSISDQNIFTSYHGEFWKLVQTGYHHHYWDNGLGIGLFGTDRMVVGRGVHAAPGMAGNTQGGMVVKESNGNLYLVHGDESDHAGMHWWEIRRTNTIKVQKIPTRFPKNLVTPTLTYLDLTSGLPFDATLSNTAGWTRTPVADSLVNQYTNTWQTNTSVTVYNRRLPVDIFMQFAQPTSKTYFVNRDLGINNVSSDWKISGDIQLLMPGGTLNGQMNNFFIEVLDDAGKILARFYADRNLSAYPTIAYRAYGNGAQLFSSTSNATVASVQPFDIIAVGGSITFNYAGYTQTTSIFDGTGNWAKPKTLRVRFASTKGPNYPVRFNWKNLKFFKDQT